MSNVIFKAYDLPAYSLDAADHILSRQENGQMGYIKAGHFATTGSNIFEGGQIIDGNLTIVGDIYANTFNVTTTSIEHFTASTRFGLDEGDTHTFTGSVYITGSLNVIGGINGVINATNGVISSSAQITSFGFVSGSYETTGRSIVSSSTQIKNYGDFATTGSNTFIGNQTITGSLLVSGSTTQIGNNTLIGNTVLSGSIEVSGSTNFRNHTITMTGSMYTSGSQTITGSLDIKGNVNVASGSEFYLAGNKLFNYGQFSDTTTQSGSADTAYSMKLNTTDFAHEVSITNGSRITPVNTGVYNLQFSAQLQNTANTTIDFDIWLAYTGSNVANSNTNVTLTKVAGSLGRSVAAWNWMLPIRANDYVEIKWSCNDSTGQLFANGTQSNPTRPAIPSVIATLTQIG